MKVTHFGPGGFPIPLAGWSSGEFSVNSNFNTSDGGFSALNFVQGITANGSNMLLRPIANVAAGSNILLTLDSGPGGSIPSNTIRIHSTASGGGGGGTGTLSTVEEVDGNPTDSAVTKLVFPNGTLSIASHVATYTPAGGSSGALVLLEQHTASSSAQLDFTTAISSTYDAYLIDVVGIRGATDGATLNMRVGTGGGPTYDTGSNYRWTTWGWTSGGSGNAGSGSDSVIRLRVSIDTTGNSTGSGQYRFYNIASRFPAIQGVSSGFSDADGTFLGQTMAGEYTTTTAVTALRFLMSSGNIAEGTIRMYGVAKT